jgi:hypothetical protein
MKIVPNEKFSLLKLDLKEAEEDGTLFFVGSTFSPADNAVRDTLSVQGPRLVTFANILKYDIFPLADILKEILKVGKTSFGSNIELEFAVNLFREKERKPEFYLLQIRPMVAGRENLNVSMKGISRKEIICVSRHAMGNGQINDIYDLVYVDPSCFDVAKTRQIASEVGEINRRLIEEDRKYILIGFGRWGTADPWLGIPVEWYQISKAKVIVESNLDDFVVDPSQGSHFFHNLISLNMGYMHIRKESEEEFIDWSWVNGESPRTALQYVRHLRYHQPLMVRIDGRKSEGVLLKPEGGGRGD